MVRALASHQCGPGLIPGPDVIYGLRLLLVLVLAPSFSPPQKTNISTFDLGSVEKKPLCRDATAKFQFISLILCNNSGSLVAFEAVRHLNLHQLRT